MFTKSIQCYTLGGATHKSWYYDPPKNAKKKKNAEVVGYGLALCDGLMLKAFVRSLA